jgi:hypothetical protein
MRIDSGAPRTSTNSSINSAQHGFVPGLALVSGAVVKQHKAVARVERDVGLDEVDYPAALSV